MTSTNNTKMTQASLGPTTPSKPSLDQESALQPSNAGGSTTSVNDPPATTGPSNSGAPGQKDGPEPSFLERRFARQIIDSANATEMKHWAQQARREKRKSEASANSNKD
jgi:hypothetical protein